MADEDHHLCGSYFRPWSPGDPDKDHILFKEDPDAESPVLDLSQKHTTQQLKGQPLLHSGIKPDKGSSRNQCSRANISRKDLAPPHGNPLCFPNPFLLQQIQAYYSYHFMRNIPMFQQPHGLTDEIIKWQKHSMCATQPDTSTHNASHVSLARASDTANNDPCFQRRGILNVPSPTFNHSHSAQPDDSWESKYPVPSAKDGEPLDLLPKSLYMNKAHGGHLCIFCGKLYSRKYGLKIHLRTHTGYKPLKCKVCQRPFGDPSNLNKHIRLHAEGDTPYRCEQCGKVLVRRRDLERHMRSRHPNEAEKLMHCGSLTSSDDGLNSSFEADSVEELDVVGLPQ